LFAKQQTASGLKIFKPLARMPPQFPFDERRANVSFDFGRSD
jgi:hypothetical protein